MSDGAELLSSSPLAHKSHSFVTCKQLLRISVCKKAKVGKQTYPYGLLITGLWLDFHSNSLPVLPSFGDFPFSYTLFHCLAQYHGPHDDENGIFGWTIADSILASLFKRWKGNTYLRGRGRPKVDTWAQANRQNILGGPIYKIKVEVILKMGSIQDLSSKFRVGGSQYTAHFSIGTWVPDITVLLTTIPNASITNWQ